MAKHAKKSSQLQIVDLPDDLTPVKAQEGLGLGI